jgi:hypothetical protein
MIEQSHRLVISRIRIGFKDIVLNGNFMDCHQALKPFGFNWGRGVLLRDQGGLFAVTGTYGNSHSRLKRDMSDFETSAGAFYYGYVRSTRTLYLEYASDRMFDFHDEGVLPAIMEALLVDSGPLMGYVLLKDK